MTSIAHHLALNAALLKQTDDQEQKILESAHLRMSEVQTRLSELRQGEALTDRHAGEEYQKLIIERAKLERLIALSERKE